MIAGSLILPIGLFWFAWTSHPDIHWAPQVVSGIFIGLGIILIFMSGVTYMVDVYLLNANSAIAINTFIRSAVAAGFPMFATYMYTSLGVDWATSLLAFVCIALIPFPLVFWFYGKKIRSLSKFAFNLG
jgi:DHA1 family multidrug resistance protein-like MFS transporter